MLAPLVPSAGMQMSASLATSTNNESRSMVVPEPPMTGSCLCGAVQVRVTAPALLTLACHCRDCQKLTASAFSLTTMVPKEGFSCTGPLIKGGLGHSQRAHYFCKSCLNFIYSQVAWAEHRINLRTAVLDNAASFPPFVEVMTKDKLPWANVSAAHSFATVPETLDQLNALMDAYAKQ